MHNFVCVFIVFSPKLSVSVLVNICWTLSFGKQVNDLFQTVDKLGVGCYAQHHFSCAPGGARF